MNDASEANELLKSLMEMAESQGCKGRHRFLIAEYHTQHNGENVQCIHCGILFGKSALQVFNPKRVLDRGTGTPFIEVQMPYDGVAECLHSFRPMPPISDDGTTRIDGTIGIGVCTRCNVWRKVEDIGRDEWE